MHAAFEHGPPAISSVQLYAAASGADYFVELSFFPDDIDTNGGIWPIVELLESMKASGGATSYLLRSANESFEPSWEKRHSPEVIFTSEDVPHLR